MWTTVLVEVATGSLEREPDALTGSQNVVAGHVHARVVDEASARDFGGVGHALALFGVEFPPDSSALHWITGSPPNRTGVPSSSRRIRVSATHH